MASKKKSKQENSSQSRHEPRDPKVSEYSGKPVHQLLEAIKETSKNDETQIIVKGLHETLGKITAGAGDQLGGLAWRVPRDMPSVRNLLEELSIFCDEMLDSPQSALIRLARLEVNVSGDLGSIHQEIHHKGFQEGYKKALETYNEVSAPDLDRLELD